MIKYKYKFVHLLVLLLAFQVQYLQLPSSAPQYNSIAPQPKPRRPPGPPFRKGPRGIKTIHTSNSCQLLSVHGTVFHIPNLLCTLDSASAVSMMTVSTARQYGFVIPFRYNKKIFQ